jgi:hypothetical protein
VRFCGCYIAKLRSSKFDTEKKWSVIKIKNLKYVALILAVRELVVKELTRG